jgi:RHS repeat-associated protein
MKHVRGFTATLYGITFDDFTETVINGSMTALMKYYSAAKRRLAMWQANTLSYLLSGEPGSLTIALSSTGSVTAVQLYSPYDSSRSSKGSMPTDYNFTGQRLDRETGLLSYGARYSDPLSGRFTQADLRQNNVVGMDSYADVGENPESRTKPTGRYSSSTFSSTTTMTWST